MSATTFPSPRIRGGFVALFGLVLAAAAQGGEERPLLCVRDASTGEPLTDLRAVLVTPAGGVHSASCSGADRPLPLPARAGGRLHLYARGYQLALVELDPGQARVEASLYPVKRSCTLRLVGEQGEHAHVEVRVTVELAGAAPADLELDDYTVEGEGEKLALLLSGGVRNRLLLQARPGIVSPLLLRARAGETIDVAYEPPRAVLLRGDLEPKALREDQVELWPDRLFVPAVDPGRIDAWRWRLNGPGWLRDDLLDGDDRLSVAPPVPFHIWACSGSSAIYRHVAPGQETLELAPASRRLASRPSLDGQPAPEGSWIAPGRLDLQALARLICLQEWLPGTCHRCADPSAPWSAPELPESDWLTIWHPEEGLAHCPWPRAGPLQARTFPGRLRIAGPEGWTLSRGTLYVYPVWRGTSALRTAPPPGPLLRRISPGSPILLKGLRPARYGLNLDLVLRGTRTGREVSVRRTEELELAESSLQVLFRIPLR